MTPELLSRPLLVARGLTKTYVQGHWPRRRHHKALDGVNLILRSGRTLALVGASGSGKTTLAMCLAALERPDSGEIWLGDLDLASARKGKLLRARTQVQVLFQDSSGTLSPLLSAAEIVEEPLRVQCTVPKQQRDHAVTDLLRQVGLTPELKTRRASQLSGGQRQRLAIARALALNPRLIILDEPFTGLDLSARGQIINLLIELQASKALSYLYVSHDLDVVSHFADEVAVMHNGRIVEWGQTDNVIANPIHSSTKVLLDASTALSGRRPSPRGEPACVTC
ncbi:MAG: dipeptide/oligopeptide/nickel ABC transporter ATP-binding protein [Candidatus Sulfotelmatobacter sp.]